MNENIIKSLNELPDILTPDEISEFMRINKSAVNRIIRSGDLKVIRYGSIVRIEKADFREWLDKCASGAFIKERKHNTAPKTSEHKDIYKNMTANVHYPDNETGNSRNADNGRNTAFYNNSNAHSRYQINEQNKLNKMYESTSNDNVSVKYGGDFDRHI